MARTSNLRKQTGGHWDGMVWKIKKLLEIGPFRSQGLAVDKLDELEDQLLEDRNVLKLC